MYLLQKGTSSTPTCSCRFFINHNIFDKISKKWQSHFWESVNELKLILKVIAKQWILLSSLLIFSIETLCLRSGRKRCLREPQIHEEPYGNPFILSTHHLRSASASTSGPLQENNTHVKGSTAGNKRSKRITQNENTLSPSKIDSHFKTSKYVNGRTLFTLTPTYEANNNFP
jgi:hypothetical protein